MKSSILIFLTLTVSLLIILPSHADDGFHLAGGIYYSYKDSETGPAYELVNDLRIGYRWTVLGNDLAVMVINESERVPSEIENEDRESLGVSLAYYIDQFYIQGAYFVDSKLSGGGRVSEIEGDGYRVDIGMNFKISETLKVGPRLSHRSFSYDEDDVGDGSYSSFEPTFAFHLFF